MLHSIQTHSSRPAYQTYCSIVLVNRCFFLRWTHAIEQEFISNWADVSLKSNKGQRRARKVANLPVPPEHVAGFGRIDKLDRMPRLLKAMSHTAGQMSNYAKLGGQVGLDTKTAWGFLNSCIWFAVCLPGGRI